MRAHFLTFVTMLSTSAEASAILIDSQTLIPSLVVFLAQQSAPLWEDSEELLNSADRTASYASRRLQSR